MRGAYALDAEAPTPARPRLDAAQLPPERAWASPAAAQAFVDAAGAGAVTITVRAVERLTSALALATWGR